MSPWTKRIVDCALEYYNVFSLEDDRGEVVGVERSALVSTICMKGSSR